MRKRPDITEATRERLKDAFWTLYRQEPMEKITVSSVVQRAGVHRSTFYEYFLDVDDVLEQIQQEALKTIEQRVLSQTGDMTERGPLEFAASAADVIAPFGEQIYYLTRDPRFQKRFFEMMKPYVIRNVGLSEDLPDTDLLFTLLTANMITVLQYWHENREEKTLRECIGTAQRILYYGAEKIIAGNRE